MMWYVRKSSAMISEFVLSAALLVATFVFSSAAWAVADLALSASDSPDPVSRGGSVSYTVQVDNFGPDTATAVDVSISLNQGFIGSLSSSQGSCTATNPIACSLGDIAATAGATISFSITTTTPGESVIEASTQRTDDPNTNNNTVTESTQVVEPTDADLRLTQTDSPDPVVVGNNLLYTITVENLGPSNSTAPLITDTLPTGVTFVSGVTPQGTGCSNTNGTVSCGLGALAAGASGTAEITVTVNEVGELRNSASVVGNENDPNLNNNARLELTTAIADDSEADMSVALRDDPDPVLNGETVTLIATVSNDGPGDVAAATMDLTISQGAFGAINPAQGSCTPSGRDLSCSLAGIFAAGSVEISVEVIPETAGELITSATASSERQDSATSNNSAEERTVVLAATDADLTLTMTDSPDPVELGDTLQYQINVQNNGPAAATNLLVTDQLDSRLRFDAADTGGTGSCSDNGGTVTCEIANLNSGAGVAIVLDVTPLETAVIENTAQVQSDQNDPATNDNQATVETTIAQANQADLVAEIIDNPDPVVVGQTVTLVVSVRNDGPNAGSNVASSTSFSQGLISAFTASQGTCTAGATLECNFGGVDAGQQASVEVQLQTSSPGTLTTSTNATADENDPNQDNNAVQESTTVVSPSDASLIVTLTAEPETTRIFGPLTYTVSVENQGPNVATGVLVTDPLPSNLIFIEGDSAVGCTVDENNVVSCGLGAINPGEVGQAVIETVPDDTPGEVTNTVTAAGLENDPDTSNNQASVTTTVIREALDTAVSPGAPTEPTEAQPGDRDVDALAFQFEPTSDDMEIRSLFVRGTGTGNDATSISNVRLHIDNDLDGQLSAGDTEVGVEQYANNNGLIEFALTPPQRVNVGERIGFVATYDFAGSTVASAGPLSGGRGAEFHVSAVLMALLGPIMLLLGARFGTGPLLVMSFILMPLVGSGLSGCSGGGGEFPNQGDLSFRARLVDVVAADVQNGFVQFIGGLPVEGRLIVLPRN